MHSWFVWISVDQILKTALTIYQQQFQPPNVYISEVASPVQKRISNMFRLIKHSGNTKRNLEQTPLRFLEEVWAAGPWKRPLRVCLVGDKRCQQIGSSKSAGLWSLQTGSRPTECRISGRWWTCSNIPARTDWRSCLYCPGAPLPVLVRLSFSSTLLENDNELPVQQITVSSSSSPSLLLRALCCWV